MIKPSVLRDRWWLVCNGDTQYAGGWYATAICNTLIENGSWLAFLRLASCSTILAPPLTKIDVGVIGGSGSVEAAGLTATPDFSSSTFHPNKWPLTRLDAQHEMQ